MDSPLLEDEKFDFDFPLSPDEESDAREEDDDDDEIFFGPVGHNERCVAINTETKAVKYLEEVENVKPLSPLNPEQVVEIFKEATSMALMLRTSSSDAGFGEQESKTCSEHTELVSDVAESRHGTLKSDIKENKITNTENSNKSSSVEKLSGNDEDKFVVRKRVLRERKNNVNKESPKTSTKKAQLKKGQSTSVQNKLQSKSSGSITKLQKFKKNHQNTSHTNSPLKVNKMLIYGVVEDNPKSPNQKVNVKKSNMVTPKRVSSSSSKLERSFSSTKSSSASDTSFTEETTKQSKLPMPSQSGLKAPGFTSSCRKQTNSNSSISSTSSTSSASALNETFTVARSSTVSPTSIKQPKTSQPNPKPLLGKINVSKLTFAKPSEVPKTSKLQPMKAIPRASVGPTRSMSATMQKSPVQNKTVSRAASAGSTPLRAQTPKADRTPIKGATSIRRRSNINTCTSSIPSKKGHSGVIPPSDRIRKPGTPQVKKATSSKDGSVRNSTSVATNSASFAKSRSSEGLKVNGNEKLSKDTKPMTPGSRSNKDKNVFTTPKNTGMVQRNSQLSRSFECKRRRSFIPTPNLNRTIDLHKTVDSGSPKDTSPVPFHLSPTLQIQSEKRKSNESIVSIEKPLDSSRNGEEMECQVHLLLSPETTEPEKIDETPSEHEGQLFSNKAESPDTVQNEEPDLMIQESPMPQLAKVHLSAVVDPFSPGIPAPKLPTDSCLNPVVLQIDTKDLIDLSHMSPMPEPDLIDLAADSPIHLVEGKLVEL